MKFNFEGIELSQANKAIASTFLLLLEDGEIKKAVTDVSKHMDSDDGLHAMAYAVSRAYWEGVNDTLNRDEERLNRMGGFTE